MSQIIHVSIKPEFISCILSDNLKEREYNFSLKLSENHKDYLSNHSENFKGLWIMHRGDNESHLPTILSSANSYIDGDEANYNNAFEECKKSKKLDTIKGIKMKSNHSRFNSSKKFSLNNSLSILETLDSNHNVLDEIPILQKTKSITLSKLDASSSPRKDAKVNTDSLPISSPMVSEFKPKTDIPLVSNIHSKKEMFWNYRDSLQIPPNLEVIETLRLK